MATISGSVGAGDCLNDPDDVQTIQAMLNMVPVVSGGPSIALQIAPAIDAATIEAITAFQRTRYSTVDARVDPNGRTLADLNVYASAFADSDPAADPPEVFCDVRVTAGPAGPSMMLRLRQVERDLRDQPPLDVDFRSFCGVRSVDGHQNRAQPIPVGKAVDLNADTNPYVVTRTIVDGQPRYGGEQGGSPLDAVMRAKIAAIYDRAVSWLFPGAVADIGVRRPGEATLAVHARFQRVSSSLSSYLSNAVLPTGPSRLTRPVMPAADLADYDTLRNTIPSTGSAAERWPDADALRNISDFISQNPTPPPPIPGADLVSGWHAQILRDYELMRLPLVMGSPSLNPAVTRNPVFGFIDLPDFVVAAMTRSGLSWGACDLGISESGDMMHFQDPGNPGLRVVPSSFSKRGNVLAFVERPDGTALPSEIDTIAFGTERVSIDLPAQGGRLYFTPPSGIDGTVGEVTVGADPAGSALEAPAGYVDEELACVAALRDQLSVLRRLTESTVADDRQQGMPEDAVAARYWALLSIGHLRLGDALEALDDATPATDADALAQQFAAMATEHTSELESFQSLTFNRATRGV